MPYSGIFFCVLVTIFLSEANRIVLDVAVFRKHSDDRNGMPGREGKRMKRKESRLMLWAAVLAIMLYAAGCGKKTVDPPPTQETESDHAETESGTKELTESTETGTENAGQDQLTGGGTGEVIYEIRHVEKQYEADDGTVIFGLKLAYPVLAGEAEGIGKINSFFQEWYQKKLDEYEADENSTRQSALEVYRESRDAGWAGPWGEEYEVSSIKGWGGYVSILLDSYLYEGGAHGMPYREGHVFRLSDGKPVELADLTGQTQEEWNKLLIARFSQLVSKGKEVMYYEDALDRLKERDMKDTGYYFTDTGIAFYLPPYEIAPYSTGYVEIEIPFEEAGINRQ